MGKTARRGLWIAGESVSGSKSQWFPTLNPATAEVLCEVAEAGEEDVDRAVQAAQAGLSE